MSFSPKVTVVTVCFNAKLDLEKTITNIASLSYSNLEYLVIDGGSSDGTVQLLESNESNISKWVSEPDSGIYEAMNKGIMAASGEWIIFMNAGDLFAKKDVIENVMLEANCEIDFIYGDRVRVEVDGTSKIQKAGNVEHTLIREVVFHQALFNRVSRLKRRPYNTFYKLAADYEYVVNAWSTGATFKYIPMVICQFMCGGNSRTEQVRIMTEAIKITIDYQPDKRKWRKSDFFIGLIGNNVEAVLNHHVQKFIAIEDEVHMQLIIEKDNKLNIKTTPQNNEIEGFIKNIFLPLKAKGLNFNVISKEGSNLPKVSIVTVVFNDPIGMASTLKSIQSLNFSNAEYIVVDGGSTDATRMVIEESKESIDIYVSEPDDGIYDAMNKAIDLATGDYIIFMNAGDVFETSLCLEEVFRSLESMPDVIYGDRNYIKNNGQITFQPSKNMDTIFERMPYCHQSALVKLSTIRKYKFDTTYKFAADYNQIMRMYKDNCVFKKVPVTICDFLQGGKSESGIRPYLEAIKIQLDNAEKDFNKSKSVYLNGLHNGLNSLIEKI